MSDTLQNPESYANEYASFINEWNAYYFPGPMHIRIPHGGEFVKPIVRIEPMGIEIPGTLDRESLEAWNLRALAVSALIIESLGE